MEGYKMSEELKATEAQEQVEAPEQPHEPDKKEQKQSEPEKKYTDADVDAIIDKKFAKWQKEHESKVKEAEKLAEMNAQEKAEYERDELQKRLDELENKTALAEMTKVARTMLKDKHLNIGDELLEILVTPDAEKTKQNVDSFSTLFAAAVDAEVNERLKSTAPKRGVSGAVITREEIANIKDPVERRKLIEANPHLYK